MEDSTNTRKVCERINEQQTWATIVTEYVFRCECISVCSMPIAEIGTFLTNNCVFWPFNLFLRLFVLGAFLRGNHPYPGLLWVLYNSNRIPNFLFAFGQVGTHKTIPGVYTADITLQISYVSSVGHLIPVPGTSGSSGRRCHKDPRYGYSMGLPARNFWKFCAPVLQYPEVLEVL